MGRISAWKYTWTSLSHDFEMDVEGLYAVLGLISRDMLGVLPFAGYQASEGHVDVDLMTVPVLGVPQCHVTVAGFLQTCTGR